MVVASQNQSRNSPLFIGPEGSLPCSEEPTTGPYPEPEESNPQLLTLFLQNPFSHYPPTHA
jgi:hypothetical protein